MEDKTRSIYELVDITRLTDEVEDKTKGRYEVKTRKGLKMRWRTV